MRASPVRRIIGPPKICYDCDHELYHNGKIIFDDESAKQDRNGRWHCSDCQLRDRRRTLLKMYGPNHEKTRYFLQQEEKNVRAWNQAAKKLITGPYRKNKYTGETPFCSRTHPPPNGLSYINTALLRFKIRLNERE